MFSVAVAMQALLLVSAAQAISNESVNQLYSPYAELLDDYLIEKKTEGGGLVSAFQYRQAIADPAAHVLVKRQKDKLAAFDPGTLANREQATAFWLNAYNFFMIAYILEHPNENGELISGVKDYGSWVNPYWVFSQQLFEIGGHRYSLSEIEKDILLGRQYKDKGWKDARVHFAVNCASVGCPPLRKTIYKPQNVDAMLTENTRLALRTARHMHFKDNTLYLTQLFEWYEDDFVEQAGSIGKFLKQYTDASVHEKIDAASKIKFIHYDWALNEPENFSEVPRTVAHEKPDTNS